jgi:hypothetical protein
MHDEMPNEGHYELEIALLDIFHCADTQKERRDHARVMNESGKVSLTGKREKHEYKQVGSSKPSAEMFWSFIFWSLMKLKQ